MITYTNSEHCRSTSVISPLGSGVEVLTSNLHEVPDNIEDDKHYRLSVSQVPQLVMTDRYDLQVNIDLGLIGDMRLPSGVYLMTR